MMESIKNLLVGIIVLGSVMFGITQYNNHQEDKVNQNKIEQLEDKVAIYEDYIQSADSAIFALEDEKAEVSKQVDRYKHLWLNERDERIQIENKYDSLKTGVDSLSLDSLAKYIVTNYVGTGYKIERISDTIYIAFQDTTVRDIVKKHVDYKKRGEVIDNLDNQVEFLDSVNSKLSKELMITESINDSLEYKIDTLEAINVNYKDLYEQYQDEATRQEKYKIVSYIVNGVQMLAIIAVAI